jgi:pilus assembly protein FimV
VLHLSSDRAVQEPFVDVILEVSWSSGRLVREYTLLFDPPGTRTAPPAVAAAPTGPVISPAPAPAPAAKAPAPAPAVAATEPAPKPVARPAPAPAPAPAVAAAPTPAASASSGADQVTVRPGDTLFRIANRTQRPGVSLDQMLVSLYRGNPTAFIDSNMNRLKSGVVLSVPSADAAQQVSNSEARQIIQAQSADFGSYRQRLASAVPSAGNEEPARHATGKVQAAVEDRKQNAQTSPDRLTLSQGSVKSSAPEVRIAKEAERKEQTQRVAELSRNVEELKRLSGKPASAAPAPAAKTPAPAPAPTVKAPAPAPAPVAKAPAPAPVASTPSLPPVPVKAPVVAPVVPPVASAPAPAVAVASRPAPASAPFAASAPKPAASKPRPHAKPAPMPVEEPSFFDNPLVLPAALIALLGAAGFGFLRWRGRNRRDSGETSFLESRLQPDSFFGASGGQRIDTRDASGVSSSMSYSLSQLDAIGDVDPVAEADVYLAYGRDLQAEEILKEAMRGNPDRLAIRTKLLEVYAKRRDTKGFESLANQLFGLTHGEGEDWAKAQELGRSIDPENPLYQPGGQPPAPAAAPAPMEPMRSTMPMEHSVSGFQPSQPAPVTAEPPAAASDLDLNLDAPELAAPSQAAAPAPAPAPSHEAAGGLDLDFDLPSMPAPAAAAAAPAPMEFDLNSLSLDLDTPAAPAQPMAPPAPEMAELELPDVDGHVDAASDPLARKLELAEEFRQIGDMEGARDLLEEVVSKASGSLKAKAQGLLETLA